MIFKIDMFVFGVLVLASGVSKAAPMTALESASQARALIISHTSSELPNSNESARLRDAHSVGFSHGSKDKAALPNFQAHIKEFNQAVIHAAGQPLTTEQSQQLKELVTWGVQTKVYVSTTDTFWGKPTLKGYSSAMILNVDCALPAVVKQAIQVEADRHLRAAKRNMTELLTNTYPYNRGSYTNREISRRYSFGQAHVASQKIGFHVGKAYILGAALSTAQADELENLMLETLKHRFSTNTPVAYNVVDIDFAIYATVGHEKQKLTAQLLTERFHALRDSCGF